MKKLLLSLACLGLISAPAFAGTCPSDGCGGKSKDGDKGKEGTKHPLVIRVVE